MILVYLLATEGWKWGKRVYLRRRAKPIRGPTDKSLRLEMTIAPDV